MKAQLKIGYRTNNFINCVIKLKYIFDTSAVLLLICDCKLFDELLSFKKNHVLDIPHKVYEECLIGKLSIEHLQKIEALFDIINVAKNEKLLPYFHGECEDGEFWVISHALNNKEYCCVIDEKFGRRLCEHFIIKKTGSIGIIKELYKLNIIKDDQLSVIELQIRNSSFYFTNNLLKELSSINDNVS